MELDQQAWFDLIGAYHYLFPATTSQFTIMSGYELNFKMQTSGFFPDNLGVNWFFEFSLKSIPSTTFTQTNSLFMVGITALIGY
jgi:hypothetical protein